jgi:hypothetical protein
MTNKFQKTKDKRQTNLKKQKAKVKSQTMSKNKIETSISSLVELDFSEDL